MPGLSAAYWVYNSLRLKSNLKLPMTTKQGKNSLCLNLADKTWHQLLTPNRPHPPPPNTHIVAKTQCILNFDTCIEHAIKSEGHLARFNCWSASKQEVFFLRFWPPYTRVHVLVWVNMEIIAPVDALNIFIMINHSSEN